MGLQGRGKENKEKKKVEVQQESMRGGWVDMGWWYPGGSIALVVQWGLATGGRGGVQGEGKRKGSKRKEKN